MSYQREVFRQLGIEQAQAEKKKVVDFTGKEMTAKVAI